MGTMSIIALTCNNVNEGKTETGRSTQVVNAARVRYNRRNGRISITSAATNLLKNVRSAAIKLKQNGVGGPAIADPNIFDGLEPTPYPAPEKPPPPAPPLPV